MSLRALSLLKGCCLVGMVAAISYYIACLLAAARFFHTRAAPGPAETPGISVLKPVKGIDDEAYENFASFCRQDYPAAAHQIIFAVSAADDPAIPLIRRLQAAHAGRDIQLVIATDNLGPNRKISSLAQVVPQVRFDLLAISDGDIRVGPDYLQHLARPFTDPWVGLATCPYRGAEPANLPATLLALGINAEFVPSVLLAQQLEGLSFALGATMVIRRAALDTIGGFPALLDYLADDYLLGNLTHRAGYRLVLVPYVVDHVIRRAGFREYCEQQLRWARTVRVARPVGFCCSIITHGPLYALGYLLLAGPVAPAWALLGTTLGARVLTAGAINALYLKSPRPWRYLWLLPLRDLIGTAVWIGAFLGNRITWRGQRYRLGPGGRLISDG